MQKIGRVRGLFSQLEGSGFDPQCMQSELLASSPRPLAAPY